MEIFSTSWSSSSFITALSANVSDILSNIGPVLELIIGILFAFTLAKYIIQLINIGPRNEAGEKLLEDDLGHIHHELE